MIPEKEIAALPSAIKKMVKDFCPIRGDNYLVPDFGMNAIDISYYLNHSNRPNIKASYDKRTKDTEFRTSRHIKAGEELISDYATYSKE